MRHKDGHDGISSTLSLQLSQAYLGQGSGPLFRGPLGWGTGKSGLTDQR